MLTLEATAAADEAFLVRIAIDGRFASGSPFILSVGADGNADLTIDTFPNAIHRRFIVAPKELLKLKELLAEVRFAQLPARMGQRVPDGSTRTIACKIESKLHTVELGFLMNWVHSDRKKLSKPARGLRVWALVRSWFDDGEAVDLSRYDRMVLDAVEK